MTNRIIRTVVVGVGYLGQWHARKIASLKSVKLVGVVDKNFERAKELGGELGCTAFENVKDVPDEIESAIVAVPTERHYEVANALLDKGAHILVEKPFTGLPDLAKKIIRKAGHIKRKVAVGFVERMNPAFQIALQNKSKIKVVEARRLAPFKLRAAKLDVIKDLMIHDIDLALCLLGKNAKVEYAWGESVLTDKLDLAGAILNFKNGGRAYLMAGRIFNAEQRVMNIINERRILALDLKEHKASRLSGSRKELIEKPLRVRNEDALTRELTDFFNMIRGKRGTIATGEDGLMALELVCETIEAIKQR